MFSIKVPLGGARVPDHVVDIAIIGGGPAGYAAGLYASRAGRDTWLIEKGVPGGQMATTELIENCPGCLEASGAEIGANMRKQAVKFGLNEITTEVTEIDLASTPKRIVTSAGEFQARVVLVGTGAQPKRLGIPGEEGYWGRGISACATCDGPFFRDKDILVVGGGSTALQESLYLTRFVKSLTIVHRRGQFRGEAILQKRLAENPKVRFMMNTVVEEITGNGTVDGVMVREVTTGATHRMAIDGVFIFIGVEPVVDLVRDQLDLDAYGHIVVDEHMHTNVDGVFAIGDVRSGAAAQVVTAMSDGAVAALAAEHLLSSVSMAEFLEPSVVAV